MNQNPKNSTQIERQQLQARAFNIYAAIGELTVKLKQIDQQKYIMEDKIHALEDQIVSISKSLEALSLEGVSNVD